MNQVDWRDAAGCREGDAIHYFAPAHFERKPEKDHREGQARAICRGCPVRAACLEHSLATSEFHGIWGGLNELERRRLARNRVRMAQVATA